jgi:hypothetical protein
MNSRERIHWAFDHREPDRVPVFELNIDSPVASEILGRSAVSGFGGYVRAKLRNESLIAGTIEEYRQQKMEDELELYRELELDMIRAPWRDLPALDPGLTNPMPPANPIVPERLDENTWRFTDREHDHWSVVAYDPESVTCAEVDSSIYQNGIEEFERLVEEMEGRDPSLEDASFTQLEWLVENAPDMAILGTAEAGYKNNSWTSVFLEAMALKPDLVDRYLDATLRQTLLVLEAQLQRGVDVVCCSIDFCSSIGPIFSPRHYARFLQPRYRAIAALCHQYDVPYFKHACGNITRIEKALLLESGFDGWHAVDVVAGMDIGYFKDEYGRQITLMGNIDCGRTLTEATIEEVKDEVREKIHRCAPGGGYVLASSASIHGGVKTRNYLAMLEAAREYGQYPITA